MLQGPNNFGSRNNSFYRNSGPYERMQGQNSFNFGMRTELPKSDFQKYSSMLPPPYSENRSSTQDTKYGINGS